jgi:hypothetical protein
MPKHVHLILVPSDTDGLRRALARVHRSYAGAVQARRKHTAGTCQARQLIEPRQRRLRLTAMLQSLLSAIVEALLSAAGAAIVRFFGLENVIELVTAIVGLSCIVIGFAIWWFGY